MIEANLKGLWYKAQIVLVGTVLIFLSWIMVEKYNAHWFFWSPLFFSGIILLILSISSIAYTLKEWF